MEYYTIISTSLLMICFLHFVIPPVSQNAHKLALLLRALLGLGPVCLAVFGMIFAPIVYIQVLFGVMFGAMVTIGIIRTASYTVDKKVSEQEEDFQSRAQAYNQAHSICDELLYKRAQHLQRNERSGDVDLEIVAQLDLETRRALDEMQEAVVGLKQMTAEFPDAQTTAQRAIGHLSMFKRAIEQIRQAESQLGWHEDEEVPEVSEDDVEEFRNFLNEISPADFSNNANPEADNQ